MVSFLRAHPDKAAAWASVLGIRPPRPRLCRRPDPGGAARSDTAVTNHGYADGHVTSFPAVLQAGTAVLIDRYGQPVTKCFCGNPLTRPTAYVRPAYTGKQWPSFSPASVTIIKQSTVAISSFTVVDPATSATFRRPSGSSGSADQPVAAPVGNPGIIATIAGNGIPAFCGDGGPATQACVGDPIDLAMDAAGNLYIGGQTRVQRVAPDGTITTVAGNGTQGFCGDGGPAIQACLHGPEAPAVDAAGNLYIADASNNRVRRVEPDGTITTIAGGNGIADNGIGSFCGDGGPATQACLNAPEALAVDAAGNLYIADNWNNRVRRVAPDGTITTVAGNGTQGFCSDGGPATRACLSSLTSPLALAVDAAGNLYIGDAGNNRVRRVAPDGTITTVAGNGTQGFCGDGGPATRACLNDPADLAVDAVRQSVHHRLPQQAGAAGGAGWDHQHRRRQRHPGVLR